MDVTRNEFEDLVGAYALDACEPDEAAAIDAFIAGNADAAAEAERLRGAAAWLGAVGALNPPVALRDRLLAAMADRPDPLPPVDALRRETDRFEALLDSLEPADLDVETYNGLSVRDLVAHIAIVDEAFVGEAPVAGATSTWSFIGADAVAQMTDAELPAIADWSFAQILDRWRAAAPGAGRARRAAAARHPGRRLLAQVGAGDPGLRDVDALPRHRGGARPRRGAGVGAGDAHDGRARGADAADRAGGQGLRLPGPNRPGRADRAGRRRLDDRLLGRRDGRAPSPTSCCGPRWSSSAGGSPTASWSTTCRSRSTATPISAGPWWTPRPPSPGSNAILHPRRPPVDKEWVTLDGRRKELIDEAFWLSHMRVGFGVFVGEALAILVYLHASPNGPHRVALSAIAVLSVCVGVALVLRAPHDRPPTVARELLTGLVARCRAGRSPAARTSTAGSTARCST